MTTTTTASATVLDFTLFRRQQQPEVAASFCDGKSLNECVEALADRVFFKQWYESVRIGKLIDEDEAEITEAIVDSIRATFQIPTEEIHHKVEVGFSIRMQNHQRKHA